MAQTAVHPALSDRYVSRSDNSYTTNPALASAPPLVRRYSVSIHVTYTSWTQHPCRVQHTHMSVSAIPWQVYLIVTTQHGTDASESADSRAN
jgi:hypothetical protein